MSPQAQPQATRRAREYETIYIMRPDVDSQEADRLAGRVAEIVNTREGKLLRLDNWGRRRLAYAIKGSSRGVFVYARFVGFEDLVAELERNLRITDAVVRYQTILLDPDVHLEDFQVDPEDVKFARLEAAQEEEEQTLAQRLGLEERPPRDTEPSAKEGEGSPQEGDGQSERDAGQQQAAESGASGDDEASGEDSSKQEPTEDSSKQEPTEDSSKQEPTS